MTMIRPSQATRQNSGKMPTTLFKSPSVASLDQLAVPPRLHTYRYRTEERIGVVTFHFQLLPQLKITLSSPNFTVLHLPLCMGLVENSRWISSFSPRHRCLITTFWQIRICRQAWKGPSRWIRSINSIAHRMGQSGYSKGFKSGDTLCIARSSTGRRISPHEVPWRTDSSNFGCAVVGQPADHGLISVLATSGRVSPPSFTSQHRLLTTCSDYSTRDDLQ